MRTQAKLTGILSWALLGIFLCAYSAMADEDIFLFEEDAGILKSESKSAAKVDEQLTEGFFSIGYRLVEGDDFIHVGEYVEDQSSPAFGLKLETFPLPHRYFFLGEYFSPHDYYGDFAYAYSDIFMVRNLLVGLHHNLDHYNYLLPGHPPAVTYQDKSPWDENFVDFMKNDLYVRLKTPDFPFHTFIKHRHMKHEGSLQERYMIGFFGGMDKTAASRDIDWKTNDLTLGVDSHLGPVEVEYTHNRYEFDPGAGAVLYDFFASAFPPGVYPHNVIPEVESSGNSLRVHTSYTGQIVAAATFSNAESENNYSGAESETWRGALDLQWMPDPAMSTFFKYRHVTIDRENPKKTTLKGTARRLSYEVREPISIKKDILSFAARYRPIGRLTINGKYEFENRARSDIDEWLVVPEDSDIHRIKLTARTRLMETLKLKAVYEYKHFENPSYNAEPDDFNKLRLNASFDPADWITALFDYSITLTQRDDLLYVNDTSLVEGGERDGRTDYLLGSVSFILSPATSLTASYGYNRWKIEQDLAYSMWNATGGTTAIPYYDRGAPYTDDAHTLALNLSTNLRKDLSLRAGISYTIAESEYLPELSQLTEFTSRETTETIVSAELSKKIMEKWEVGLKLKAGFYEDEYSGDVYDQQDEELYLSMLTLKRYF